MKFEINFKADLTPEKKELLELHFADTLKLMGIEPENLTITLREKPEPLPAWNIKKYEPSFEELLMMPMRHIEDIKRCFEACKSKQDVLRVLELAPNMFGEWLVEFDDEYKTFTIINTYYDDDEGELEEEYCYDYPEDWEDTEEEE